MSKQQVFAVLLGTVLAVGVALAVSMILRGGGGWSCTIKDGWSICS
jgi:hypothetical protein